MQAVGTHENPRASKNVEARRIIVAVKKVVEHVNKSPRAKVAFQEESMRLYSGVLKLKNAAPHRWSGVSNVLEVVLLNFAAIDSLYVDREQRENPLEAIEQEIQELYSLIKPVADLIRECQLTTVPTGSLSILALAALAVDTFNVNVDLEIVKPIRKGSNEHGAVSAGDVRKERRSHDSLTPVAQKTRQQLYRALESRWLRSHYGSGAPRGSDYVHEMQMLLHPALASLSYIDKLISDGELAQQVKTEIREKFIALMVELAECAERENHEEVQVVPPSTKRQRTSSKGKGAGHKASQIKTGNSGAGKPGKESCEVGLHAMFMNGGTARGQDMSSRYAGLGLVSSVVDTGPAPPTLEEQAKSELKSFLKLNNVTLANVEPTQTLQFWKVDGARRFPMMARAAAVLLASPASAAVLERDFSAAGRMMRANRSTTDAAWVDMILFLNGNRGFIPDKVPELSGAALQGAIPGRLKHPDPGMAMLEGKIIAEQASVSNNDDDDDNGNESSIEDVSLGDD